MPFPSVITSFPIVSPTDRLNNPSHSALENLQSSTIGQLQAFIGTDASALGSLTYDVRSPNSNGGGHVQTANKGGTGQTSYTKGDVLVAQSNSVLTKLAVGADGQGLVADSTTAVGVKWGNPGMSVSSTIAISSVWTKPANISATSKVFVQLWGGGGSGNGTTGGNGGGGGGGGGYKEGWFLASVLTSSVIVQVGKGGDSVQNNGNTGLQGNITVFDVQSSLLTAYGGGGGSAGAASTGFGGGGGGLLGSGGNAGGSFGLAGNSSIFAAIFGGNGASTGSILAAVYGGGGGGVAGINNVSSPSYAIYGGGGGGGVTSSTMGQGSFSQIGGRGSNGSIVGSASASVTAGSIPGGGGGAGSGSGNSSSGEGGKGMAIITTFL